MSEENVNTVRALLEAWNAGDMNRVRDMYDPAAIVRGEKLQWPEPGPFVGRDAIMGEFARLREAFDYDAFTVLTDFLSIGDRVVVRVAWRTLGRGPESMLETTLLYTVRNGRVFGLEFFPDHDEALEAAGLSK
jgi:ketosteroid isomerase-like protein